MYADPSEDLLGTLPSDWADQFTDDGTGKNASALEAAVKDASDWVDGFLARYGPPITIAKGNGTQVTLDCLRVHTVIRAKYEILGRKVGPEGYRNIDQGFSSTEHFLMAIQKGAPLPGALEPVPSTTSLSVTGSVMGGEIVFDEDSAVL
jgi:hypothetical protein